MSISLCTHGAEGDTDRQTSEASNKPRRCAVWLPWLAKTYFLWRTERRRCQCGGRPDEQHGGENLRLKKIRVMNMRTQAKMKEHRRGRVGGGEAWLQAQTVGATMVWQGEGGGGDSTGHGERESDCEAPNGTNVMQDPTARKLETPGRQLARDRSAT